MARRNGSGTSRRTTMQSQWPLGAVWRQVRRTLMGQPGMALLLVLITALVGGGLGLAEANMRQSAFDYQSRLTASGQYVLKASARTETGEGLLSAAACAGLNWVPGVKTAAGFASGVATYLSATIAKAPGEYMSVQHVVGDFAPMLDPSSASRFDDGVYIDAALAGRIGIAEGMRIGLTTSGNGGETSMRTVTAHLLDMSARKFNESQVLYAAGPTTGTVGECLVEFEPGAYSDDSRKMVAAALDDGRTIVSITPFLAEDTNAVPPLEQYRGRISRWFWLASGLVCFLALFMPLVFRRHEFALYRSVGAGANPTALIHAISGALILLVGHLAGFLWMILIFAWTHRSLPAMIGTLAMNAGASFCVALFLTTIGCMALARGNMASFIQKRL